jgi:hypothetical protein
MSSEDSEEFLNRCVEIDPLQLQEEYIRLPGDTAFWNARYAEAYRRWLEVKIERDVTLAEAAQEARAVLKDRGAKATVAEVEEQQALDVDVIRVRKLEAQLEADKVRLNGVMDALRAKREMLISLGAHIRLEMGNDPSVRQRMNVDREVQQNRG